MQVLDVVARTAWDGAWRPPTGQPATGKVEMAVVHHTATRNGYLREESEEMCREIAALHLARGWDDLGYNFLVDRFGQVFEGRGGGIRRAGVGAHTLSWNSRSTGIAVIGNHEQEAPSGDCLGALSAVLGWKLSLHGVEPGDETVRGHRDLADTACPGAALAAALPEVRARACSQRWRARLVSRRAPALRTAPSPPSPRP